MATILQAATQVLAQEGAGRFTTARVAEKAGVSVGSVYQYFPNKAAILFRLQSDEWRQTQEMLSRILEDQAGRRWHGCGRWCMRLSARSARKPRCGSRSATPPLRDAPEAREARAAGENLSRLHARGDAQGLAGRPGPGGRLISTTLSAVGKVFSGHARSKAEIGAYADAMADMFCAYIADVAHRA